MRFFRAMVAAAAAFSLVATSVASAAQLDVARRTDPTLDPYLRTDLALTPLTAMTADQKWLSAHSRPLVVHDSDPTVSLNVTGWASRPMVAAYYNATGINGSRPAQLAEAQPFLLSVRGQPVMVDNWRTLDVTNPAARQYWLYGADGVASCTPDRDARAALDLYACGYTSLWLDNALTTPTQGFKPTPDVNAKAWAKGVLTMLSTLRAKKPPGTTFTINMHWTDTNFGYAKKPKLRGTDPQVRAARLADQVIIEGGAIDAGLNYPFPVAVPWSYARLLTFADGLHRFKVKVQWEKTGSSDLTKSPSRSKGAPRLAAAPECRDGSQPGGTWTAGDATWKAHVRTAAFNYATALLTYAGGDSVGDMCEYPRRGWRGYEADLGSPRGKRSTTGSVVTRAFSSGFVAVNPSDRNVRVKLPRGRRGVDLASTAWTLKDVTVRSVTLAPRTAAVVKY